MAAGRQIFPADFMQPKTRPALSDSALAAAYWVDAKLPNASKSSLSFLPVAHTHQEKNWPTAASNRREAYLLNQKKEVSVPKLPNCDSNFVVETTELIPRVSDHGQKFVPR